MYDWERRSKTEKRNAGKSRFGIAAVAVIVAAAALGIFSRASDGVSPLEIEMQRENLRFGLAMAQNVSQKSSDYIQAEAKVSTQLEYVMSLAYDELNTTRENCYDFCAEDIQKLLDCISAMMNMHIASSLPLAEYEAYCVSYYSYVVDYFAEMQKNGAFTVEQYNALTKWMRETNSPYEKLKEIFDANGVTYTIRYNSDGTEYMEYEISDRGVN